MAKPRRDQEIMDKKMRGEQMKANCKGIGYKVSFDGEILDCKPKWRFPSLSLIELPVNIILDYRYSAYPFFGCLRLYINKYRFGQQKPEILTIKPIYLIRPSIQFRDAILGGFDKVIRSNLAGTNLGLHHLSVSTMQEFYKLRKQSSHSQGLASMHIAYKVDTSIDSKSQVISLAEPHHMAS